MPDLSAEQRAQLRHQALVHSDQYLAALVDELDRKDAEIYEMKTRLLFLAAAEEELEAAKTYRWGEIRDAKRQQARAESLLRKLIAARVLSRDVTGGWRVTYRRGLMTPDEHELLNRLAYLTETEQDNAH